MTSMVTSPRPSCRAVPVRDVILLGLCALGLGAMAPGICIAQHSKPERLEDKIREAQGRGVQFLVATQQPDGGWEGPHGSDLGITGVVVKGLLQTTGLEPDHPAVRNGVRFILSYVQDDGGVYDPKQNLKNYQTSVALMALAATGDAAHRPVIGRARDYLKELQWDESDGHDRSSSWYGGAGYGGHKRPDLSNTQMMVEALKESGLPASDPAYKKAMVFISRCQNWSPTNDHPMAGEGGDGGFIYTPVGDGESKAGTESDDGKSRLRSYGSMTYAAFKSMLYAEVSRDDARVQKAFDWIRHHYTLDANPNMPFDQSKEGLYYYYHVFAKALQAWGEETITDGQGVRHAWRQELCSKLIELQHSDGSWSNLEDRWYEGNPHLVTGYALLALAAGTSPS